MVVQSETPSSDLKLASVVAIEQIHAFVLRAQEMAYRTFAFNGCLTRDRVAIAEFGRFIRRDNGCLFGILAMAAQSFYIQVICFDLVAKDLRYLIVIVCTAFQRWCCEDLRAIAGIAAMIFRGTRQ